MAWRYIYGCGTLLGLTGIVCKEVFSIQHKSEITINVRYITDEKPGKDKPKDPSPPNEAISSTMDQNPRINASPSSNTEYKITNFPCNQQLFSLKQRRDGNAEGQVQTTQLCSLVSLQRYTKALSTLQRSSLVEKSRQKPQERMSVLSDVLRTNNYGVDALLRAAGVSITSSFTEIEGRVLSAPKLKAGNGEDFFPRNRRWNYSHKLGGLNSLLAMEQSPSMPMISKSPTMILGMDVSHGSPGQSDIPSIAAVVGSRQWPLISRYRASVRTQSPKVEMIDSLFKKVSDTVDEGIIRELLLDFFASSGKRKPDRDGVTVCESQFNQALNIELDQIIEACKCLYEKWRPRFTVIVAQKNHHTKFFQNGNPDNVPPDTVIDKQICHPRNNDFYMCSHAGMIGTTRPTHYHVLFDEVGFSPDDLQDLVHTLSYVYQRSTTAISNVAPIFYAHLAASQMRQFIKFDDVTETSSSHGGVTSAGIAPLPRLPRLHQNVCSSMFFC